MSIEITNMLMQLTQKQVIKEKLLSEGVVDNVWCFNNFILRLGAIICELRKEGYKIKTVYKNETGHKNAHYYLEETPEYNLFNEVVKTS